MKIQFLGAAKMVTGSSYLVTTENNKFLVDCGMFQGSKEEDKLNEIPFKFDVKDIDFMILTHAHIDHSGRIPLLVKRGFRGDIYSTKPTVDLCEIMLKDSAKIQESDVQWENKRRTRSGKPMLEPLYTISDAEDSIKYFRPCFYDEIIKVNDNISIRFNDAGHILGSSMVEIWIKEEEKSVKLVFSGDVGMPDKPLLRNPSYIKDADYLVIESTYGNSVHEDFKESINSLINVIIETTSKGGSVIIPSFAVGRTQEIIYELNNYFEYNTDEDIEYFKRVPIYIDSPMAVNATSAFMKNSYVFNDKAKDLIINGDNIFEFDNLRYVKNVDESIMLNKVKFPRVIISSSGMANAGRVRHHLKHALYNPNNAVVFVGYQAIGTLGRILLDGAEKVHLLGEEIAVKAKIWNLGGFSGHADEPMLLDWINHFEKKPKQIFIVHGEVDESIPFANTVKTKFGIECIVPELYSEHTINMENNMEEIEFSKEDMEKDLYGDFQKIKSNIEFLEKKKMLFDVNNMNQEEYTNIKNTLNDLKYQLMNLNISVGK